MLLFLLSKTITQTAGFLYPSYLSYKALKARDARALVRCLQYWAVLGIFSCFEFLADMFLFWLPFYYEMKLVFVLWLILPFTNGATVIYRTLLHPTLERHEKDIDVALQHVQTSAKQTSTEWGRRGFNAIQRVAVDSITAGLSSTGKAFSTHAESQHLSTLSSCEQVTQAMGSLFSSTANELAIPSPRIREVFSSDDEEPPPTRREGGTWTEEIVFSGVLPALTSVATSHAAHPRPMPGSSREEQYIHSQRAALQKMMDQLNRAEAEVKLSRQKATTTQSTLPAISASDSGVTSSAEPYTGPDPIPLRRSRRDVLAEGLADRAGDNKKSQQHAQPHPPRTRPPHTQSKTKGARRSKATVPIVATPPSASTSLPTDSSSSSSSAAAASDFDGLVLIGEDLTFTDRELDDLGVPAGPSTPGGENPLPAANPSDADPNAHPATPPSWFPSLW